MRPHAGTGSANRLSVPRGSFYFGCNKFFCLPFDVILATPYTSVRRLWLGLLSGGGSSHESDKRQSGVEVCSGSTDNLPAFGIGADFPGLGACLVRADRGFDSDYYKWFFCDADLRSLSCPGTGKTARAILRGRTPEAGADGGAVCSGHQLGKTPECRCVVRCLPAGTDDTDAGGA